MSRMHGERAVELLKDLKRFETLPPYNEAIVKEVAKEMTEQVAEVREAFQDPASMSLPEYSANPVVNITSIARNKRIVLAYLLFRIQRVKALRWDLESSVLPSHIQENLSEAEKQFFANYDKNLSTYMRSFPGLDLTLDPLIPPKEGFVVVRVLQDYPAILTEYGPVNLQKNTTHFLPRTAVESLIKQGILEHVQ